MPKAEKLRKIRAGKMVRPPKKWFYKTRKVVKKQYPTYGGKRVNKITAGVWHKYPKSTKVRIVKRE